MSNVISVKQQKSTLRVKKGKKETIKNVLASPYTHYWPLINSEDEINLKQILKTNLPKLKEYMKSVPWKDIKHIPKEERKEYRNKILNLNKPIDSTAKYMYFGINEVTKLLEKDEAISVLLTNDVTPQLMIKHVVDLCVLKKVPILIVPNLKQLLKECVGISSATIAFKKNLSSDSKEYLIYKRISDMFANYPVSEQHANYPQSKCSFFSADKKHTEVSKVKTDSTENNVKKEEQTETFYLYKDPTISGRVFVPKKLDENKKPRIDNVEIISKEFISFSETVNAAPDVNTYKSLIVRQVRNNPDRNKKKLDRIKNKGKKRMLK